MAVGESPAVARHRLRLALREAREAKGLTQRQVARSLEWSMAKVNRIESGEVTISTTDLQALLRLLDVTDARQVESLTDLARASRQRGWWDQPEYREHMTPAMIQSLQFELDAKVVRSFNPNVVPGLLQSHEYASAILANPWGAHLSEEDRAVRLEVRHWQREQLVTRSDTPEYLLLLDESVLLREVGGPRVASDQLYDLLRLVHAGHVTIRIIPFTHPGGYAAFGLFTIYEGAGDELGLVYRESYEADEAIVSPEAIRRYQHLFSLMWNQSLDTEASAHLVEARAAILRSVTDRTPGG